MYINIFWDGILKCDNKERNYFTWYFFQNSFLNLPEYPIILPSQDKSFKPKFWCATIDECITWTLSGFVCLLVFLLKRNGRKKKTNLKRLSYRKKLAFLFDVTILSSYRRNFFSCMSVRKIPLGLPYSDPNLGSRKNLRIPPKK